VDVLDLFADAIYNIAVTKRNHKALCLLRQYFQLANLKFHKYLVHVFSLLFLSVFLLNINHPEQALHHAFEGLEFLHMHRGKIKLLYLFKN